jgi:hypothetical protein
MSADTEELSLSFDDIDGPITLPVLEDRVEQIVQENLVYRDVFRSNDATNIASNVVQIPVPRDNGAYPKIVDEGAEFPRSHEEYELKEMDFSKFGFEVPLTMEAVEDSRIDLTQDQVDRQARQMAEDINARAVEYATGPVDRVSDGSSDDTMTYEDMLAGREALVSESYNPDLLIADVEAFHDLSASDNFLEATDQQSSMRRDGFDGRIMGMDIIEDDSGLDLGNGGPGALMVDTDLFGYEGERTPVTTEEYEEQRTQTDVYRIFARMGWLVTDPDAGVVIDG